MQRIDLIFQDRQHAGQMLANRLRHFKVDHPLVLGLARGGVVVAAEIARFLECDLDVLVARKVGAPQQPEWGIGAVAPDGVFVMDERSAAYAGVSETEMASLAQRELVEVDRRLAAYRNGRPPRELFGRTVIIVDDGLATGVTAQAAVLWARMQHPSRLILAVPICSPQAAKALGPEVDEFYCLGTPEGFMAVGHWYRDFSQTTDEEVVDLLNRGRDQ